MQEILSKTTWMEWLGVFFSIIQVLLAQKNNIHNYLFGIAGILLGMYIKFFAKLYAEFSLDFYYLIMSIYGWVFWKFGKKKNRSFHHRNHNFRKIQSLGNCRPCVYHFLYFPIAFYRQRRAVLGFVGYRFCVGRNVADGKTKNRKLDFIKHQQLYRCTAFNSQRIVFVCRAYRIFVCRSDFWLPQLEQNFKTTTKWIKLFYVKNCCTQTKFPTM